MKNVALALGVASLINVSAVTAEPAVFTVEAFSTTSVTFNITGDLSGYSLTGPALDMEQFSIAYTGDLASSWTDYSGNTWTGSPLTGTTMGSGNTGTWGDGEYTWSTITPEATSGSTFTGLPVTVSWTPNGNTLDTSAMTGDFIFYIGNGSNSGPRDEIGRVAVGDVGGSVVPEPSSIAMFGIGALGLFGYSRRRRQTSAAA